MFILKIIKKLSAQFMYAPNAKQKMLGCIEMEKISDCNGTPQLGN